MSHKMFLTNYMKTNKGRFTNTVKCPIIFYKKNDSQQSFRYNRGVFLLKCQVPLLVLFLRMYAIYFLKKYTSGEGVKRC